MRKRKLKSFVIYGMYALSIIMLIGGVFFIESIVDNEKLICMIGNPDDFKDERIKNDLLKLQEKHKELEKSYERRLENEEVIREDYLFAKLVPH